MTSSNHQDLVFEIRVEPVAAIASVVVTFVTGGRSANRSFDMTRSEDRFTVTIPRKELSKKKLEYFFAVSGINEEMIRSDLYTIEFKDVWVPF